MPSSEASTSIFPLPPFQPDLQERAWVSVPHPTLPLLATAHAKSVTVFSLATLSSHSTLTGGHTRSVRSVAWEPGLPAHKLCLVTGSFDSTAGLWRWDCDDDDDGGGNTGEHGGIDDVSDLETELTCSGAGQAADAEKDWEFTVVLEGHESEIKTCAFSPSGAYLATCSRDKTVWIWEDVGGPSGAEDEWETLAILNEHEGDVKAVTWCPDVPGRNARRCYSPDVLASASYDNTVRVWREDSDGEWVCVAVLEGHQGTVWGVQWEPRPARDDHFPRLLSFSSDATLRVWTLGQADEDDDDHAGGAAHGSVLSGIPNTMRRSLREEWTCTAVLPKVHHRDIYSASWSGQSGLVASTGSDGIIALYKEAQAPSLVAAAASPPYLATAVGDQPGPPAAAPTSWELITLVRNAHGPYEINHITWCRRYDAGVASRRGEEEMLVTTGDDGLVRPWQLKL